MAKKVLMASLGTFKYTPIVYSWDSDEYSTPFSCLALLALLKEKGDTINEMHLFLTEGASKQHSADVIAGAKKLGVETKIIPISDGNTVDEVWKVFDTIVNNYYEQKIELYLDVTNGFRHLPMIFFASTLYLETLNTVNLSGVFYSAVNQAEQRASILDITPLAKIIMGSFAVRQFEESGDLLSVQKFLTDVFEETEEKDRYYKNSSAIKRLEPLHYAIVSGLPMEAGYNAKGILESIDRLPEKFELKALRDLLTAVRDRLDKIAIKSSSGKKETIFALDIPELERQLEFINWHLAFANIDTALLLLREWIITRMYMEEVKDENWLGSKKRGEIEKKLGFWRGKLSKAESLFEGEPTQKELIELWDEVSKERNKYAHAGMQRELAKPETTGLVKAKKAYEFCLKNLEDPICWRLPEAEDNKKLENVKELGEERVLVTPLGSSRGLLYTAIKLVKPDRVVVLTSDKFKDTVEEVCQKADFIDNNKIHIKVINDPFSGFEEGAQLATEVVSNLKNIKDLYVSFTGGTTAMQFAMQELWDLAKTKFPSKRVAFVDKRAVTEQQSNPYIVGEILYIDELLNRKGD